MINDAMWDEFDETIERISNDPAAQWCHVEDLFNESEPEPIRVEQVAELGRKVCSLD